VPSPPAEASPPALAHPPPQVNTLVCTTRKFFNILLSVVINANPLMPIQWAAVAMVFTGLLTSSLTKKHGHHKPQEKKE
jgi:UDP-galactose transporter B1